MCRSGWSHLRGERADSSRQSPSVETEDDPGDQRKGKDRRAELRRHYGEGNAASHQLADQPAAPHIEEDRQRGEEPVHPIVAEEDAAVEQVEREEGNRPQRHPLTDRLGRKEIIEQSERERRDRKSTRLNSSH